jgi:hypothetical protein
MIKETHNFVARFGASRSSGGTRPFDSASSQKSCVTWRRPPPTAVEPSEAITAKRSAFRWGCDGPLDAPFFANDRPEGAEKAGGRPSMFQLHAGLDLEEKKRHARAIPTIAVTERDEHATTETKILTTSRAHASTQTRVHGA